MARKKKLKVPAGFVEILIYAQLPPEYRFNDILPRSGDRRFIIRTGYFQHDDEYYCLEDGEVCGNMWQCHMTGLKLKFNRSFPDLAEIVN